AVDPDCLRHCQSVNSRFPLLAVDASVCHHRRSGHNSRMVLAFASNHISVEREPAGRSPFGRSTMAGIHHVTAIAGNAARNLAFYTRTLGLRFVKKTVNFDDPGTYHFYFGDEVGRPGTILTFFPWEHAAAGRAGVGQTQETTFRVPARSLGYWTHRFVEKGVSHQAPEQRFGESVLTFT